jgi:hypothetical protein
VVLRDQRTNLAISEGTRLATSKAAAASTEDAATPAGTDPITLLPGGRGPSRPSRRPGPSRGRPHGAAWTVAMIH